MHKWGQVLRFASSIPNQINSAKQKARLDPIYFKRGQRAWLKERNQCTDDDCLARVYENRISELRDFVRIEYDPNIWLEEQVARIKAALAGKALYIHPDTPSNTPFCHQLLGDSKTLEGMEFVAPEVITDNLDAAEVKSHILNYCPDFYRGDALAAPRKIVLYNVNIDNTPDNGTQWLLGDHYIDRISPEWGDELLVKNMYLIIDVNDCREFLGVFYVGASQRYGPATRPAGLALDTGIHGVLRYRDKYYIYDVIDEAKVDPFRLQEYLPEEKNTKAICVIKERHD